MTDISTTFTISTVEFSDGPYQAPNIGEVVSIPAGATSVSAVGFPPAPPELPGTAVPLDTWMALTESGSDYLVTTAAAAATANDAGLVATEDSYAWTIADTGTVADTIVTVTHADVIPSAGAPFTLNFSLLMTGDAARATDWFLDFNLCACATNPGDHAGGSFPMSDVSASKLNAYAYRFIGLSPPSDLRQVGSPAGPIDVTGTTLIALAASATELSISFNGTVVYTNDGITAADFPAGALLTMKMEWDSQPGATSYGMVLSGMRWTAP